jgi:hypothetical protein
MKPLAVHSMPGLLRWGCWTLFVTFALASCATGPRGRVYETPAALQSALASDVRTLLAVRAHLDAWEGEISQLQEQGDWVSRGYFSAIDNDRMENLLFRFVTSHAALWDITAAYQNMQAPVDVPALDAKAHVVAHQASLLLASHSAFLVATFAGDPVAIDKMNEAFYRSEIPKDTYYRLTRNITSKRLQRLERTDAFVAAALANSDSETARLAASDALYGELIEFNTTLQTTAEERLRAALDLLGIVAPEAVRNTEDVVDDDLYASRSILFKDVSRLKNPTAHLIRFSDEQKAQVFALLRPGDLILTYTAGYMSDVFIPGAFKHGITYVGSLEERRQVGLEARTLPTVAPDVRDRLAAHVDQANLESGEPANMIEAVAEGVIFNNLTRIMDTHINRLLVLRPTITDAERLDFLIEIFSYLGEDYDFRFDFADSTSQVCTELIYRAINGKGGIAFGLTMRAGHETLSADDIALYFLETHPDAFEFVLYAEEDPGKQNHDAMILTGGAGVDRLRTLIKSVGE